MADSVKNRTVIAAVWMVAWRMCTRLFGLASTLILARLLVPADFGLVQIATAFAYGIDALSELGLVAALVRHEDGDSSLFDTAFTLQVIRGLLTGVLIAMGAAQTSLWFHDARLTPVLLILALSAAVAGFENIAVVKFQRELRFDVEFRLLFGPRLVQFIAATAAAILWRSYWALVIGIVVGRVARTVMTYWVAPYRPRFSLSRLRDLAHFSFWSWATALVYMVWNRADAFVLGPGFGVASLGIFLLCMEIGLMPTTELVDPAARALFAGVAASRNQGGDTVKMALPLMAALLMVVVPIGLGVSATAGYVVAALLGPHWLVGRPVIAIFSLLCMLTPVSYVAATVLNASGHVQRNFGVMAVASSFRVLALYLVSGSKRLDLAALAVCAAVGVESILFVAQLMRHGPLGLRESAGGLLRVVLANGCVAALALGLHIGWQDVAMTSLPALATGGAIGALCLAGAAGIQLGLWWISGKPAGPETLWIGIAADLLRRRRGA